GSIHTIHPKNEKIEANFVSSFNELSQTPHGTMLLCGNSAHLPDIPDESVDFVITDPPYYDNIHYSELSNFFYVWLSLLIKHPYFASEYVPAEQEAIVNKGINKGEEDYQYLLTSVFKECKRVLKKNGFLIFTFHHTKWQAWWTVLNAIVKSGFCVTDSFPVLSEYKVNPHIRNKQSLDMDLVLMCSKRDIKFEAANLSIEEIRQFAMNRISLGNLGNNRLFLYFMGKMLEVISKNWDTQKVDYEFFLNALTNFDDLVVINQNHIPEKISEPQQLDLF
ncbi:hypothetical protein FJZ33_11475, partial [Candidatus Poribacteria bacterium]|nr:hypothetical protein [Candidatus Poribacteria bacterium]